MGINLIPIWITDTGNVCRYRLDADGTTLTDTPELRVYR